MSTSNVSGESRRPAPSVYLGGVNCLVRSIFATHEHEVTNYTGKYSLGANILAKMFGAIVEEEVRDTPDQKVHMAVTTVIKLQQEVNNWLDAIYKYSNGGDIFWMAHCLYLSLYVRNHMCSFGDFHPFGEIWKELDQLAQEYGQLTFRVTKEGYVYVT